MAASRVAEGSGPAHESGMEGSMLASLPHELVKLVLDHLEPNDMLALEYTCRAGRGYVGNRDDDASVRRPRTNERTNLTPRAPSPFQIDRRVLEGSLP